MALFTAYSNIYFVPLTPVSSTVSTVLRNTEIASLKSDDIFDFIYIYIYLRHPLECATVTKSCLRTNGRGFSSNGAYGGKVFIKHKIYIRYKS